MSARCQRAREKAFDHIKGRGWLLFAAKFGFQRRDARLQRCHPLLTARKKLGLNIKSLTRHQIKFFQIGAQHGAKIILQLRTQAFQAGWEEGGQSFGQVFDLTKFVHARSDAA